MDILIEASETPAVR
jgi:hypothetical protein